jgi:hypothetical protein
MFQDEQKNIPYIERTALELPEDTLIPTPRQQRECV